jgi:hypothetical protein
LKLITHLSTEDEVQGVSAVTSLTEYKEQLQSNFTNVFHTVTHPEFKGNGRELTDYLRDFNGQSQLTFT